MIRELWKSFRAEGTTITAIATVIIAVATAATTFIVFLDYTSNKETQEYIVLLRKGQQKIDLGNGNFLGGKLLMGKDEKSRWIGWYWKKNMEPHLITKENADHLTVFAGINSRGL